MIYQATRSRDEQKEYKFLFLYAHSESQFCSRYSDCAAHQKSRVMYVNSLQNLFRLLSPFLDRVPNIPWLSLVTFAMAGQIIRDETMMEVLISLGLQFPP